MVGTEISFKLPPVSSSSFTIVFQLLIRAVFLVLSLILLKLKPHLDQQSVTFTTSIFNPLLSGGGSPLVAVQFLLTYPSQLQRRGCWLPKMGEKAMAIGVEWGGKGVGEEGNGRQNFLAMWVVLSGKEVEDEGNGKEIFFFFFTINTAITRLTLNPSGSYERLVLENGSNTWDIMFTLPYEPCDNYGYCGPNGICKINRSPICECLEGFVPRSQNEWEFLNWSNGCTRKMPLDCRRGEGFIKLVGVKLPDLLEFWLNKSMSLHECKEMCLKNCSCTAYANSDIRDRGSGCLLWFGDLVDVRELRVQRRKQDVYIRLSASAMSKCL
ncbi:hypothetical protein FEM48_Zijuj01G0211700 [Ziziphus jujuba var. spinosa]|uniref:Apple domain-containing protein n=1 Tax=Ziziphus jujuba var. spinosa TaxID=714518 RepID=A0A978W3K6_ZIZJJ|nr:hypothetical protein FEM48_Zijuj01G0211700 [Ziziphus jujuba var. spinosa]